MNDNSNPTIATQSQPPLPSVMPTPIYKGIGGWLVLLCLALTIFSPLMTIASIFSTFVQASNAFSMFPGLLVITIIDSILSLGLMAFSIYAGVSLWRIRPGAVIIAKRFLLTVLGYSAIAAILPFIAGLPSSSNDAMVLPIVIQTFRAAIFVIIWYLYLTKSKRVHATFLSQ